jgi:hypothetical protein
MKTLGSTLDMVVCVLRADQTLTKEDLQGGSPQLRSGKSAADL